MNKELTDYFKISEKIKKKSCFIIDLDGVVYQGRQPIIGAVEAIDKFSIAGKKIAFLTNNSASSPGSIIEKLLSFGIFCNPHSLITASQASALFIKERQLDSKQGVFVVGSAPLKTELLSHGISFTNSSSCGAILVGLDLEFSYSAIAEAMIALNRGVPFIICNRDANFPGEAGKLMPGCGAMVGALEGASGRKADFEVGKPQTIMLDILLNRLQVLPEECLIIGDSLDADILMANYANIMSVWISKKTPVFPVNHSAKPDISVVSLSELANYIN